MKNENKMKCDRKMSVADTDIKGINVISSNEVNLFVKMKKKTER